MKVVILKSPLTGYEDVTPKQRPWTKHLKKNIGIDETIFLYIKSKYPSVFIEHSSLDKVVKTNDYDMVWAGTEIYANAGWIYAHKPKTAKRIFSKLRKIKNLFPSYEYIQYMGNKCAYTTELKLPFTPTNCISSRNKSAIMSIAKKYKGNVFIKPALGSESIDVYSDTNNDLENYLLNIQKKKVHDILIVQPRRVFCTECNPEIKAYFVGKKFSYAIGMKWGGDVVKFYKRLPYGAFKVGVKTVKELNKLEPTIVTRVDMYKYNNRYIINEIEIAPSIATEDIDNIKNWNYDKHVGDRLVDLLLNRKMSSIPMYGCG